MSYSSVKVTSCITYVAKQYQKIQASKILKAYSSLSEVGRSVTAIANYFPDQSKRSAAIFLWKIGSSSFKTFKTFHSKNSL